MVKKSRVKECYRFLSFVAYLVLVSTILMLDGLLADDSISLHRFEKKGKWGFKNSTGAIIIAPQFELANDFNDGFASVRKGMKWGYITMNGKFIIEPQFDWAENFNNGSARIIIGGKYSWIDPNFQGELKFLHDDDLQDGLRIVTFNGKLGFMDKSGTIVIDPQFDQVWPFHQGYAQIKIGTKWGFIDKSGKIIVKAQFDHVGHFNNDLAPVAIGGLHEAGRFQEIGGEYKSGGQWGYIDRKGKWVIRPKFDEAYDFQDNGTAVVADNSKYGLVDKSGKYIVTPKYDYLEFFVEGLALVNIGGEYDGNTIKIRAGGKWGFIDETGKIAIPIQFDSALTFRNGVSAVRIGDKKGIIDKSGKFIEN